MPNEKCTWTEPKFLKLKPDLQLKPTISLLPNPNWTEPQHPAATKAPTPQVLTSKTNSLSCQQITHPPNSLVQQQLHGRTRNPQLAKCTFTEPKLWKLKPDLEPKPTMSLAPNPGLTRTQYTEAPVESEAPRCFEL